jgi:cell wall-associated NlpC family hydrolase
MRRRVGFAVILMPLIAGLAGCATAAGPRPNPFPRAPVASTPAPAESSDRPAAAAAEAAADPVRGTPGGDVVRIALSLRGVKYREGGDSPAAGFDCSGFVRYVFAQERIELPRTVAEQFSVGAPEPLSEVQQGDLVFFTTIAPGPSHVGLAIGDGEFIHAPSGFGAVRVERLDSRYWHDRVIAVKRLY